MKIKINLILVSIFSLCFSILNNVIAEPMNYRNNPEWQIFKHNDLKKYFPNLKPFVKNISELPRDGSIASPTLRVQDEKEDMLPFSDTYWPHYLGGVSSRWVIQTESEMDKWNYHLDKMDEIGKMPEDTWYFSPTEKYDLFKGDLNWTATKTERNYSNIQKLIDGIDYEIDPWAGICNAWSESTYTFKNPHPILLTGKLGHQIYFSSSDLKGLLASSLDQDRISPEFTVGDRCFDTIPEKFRLGNIPDDFKMGKSNIPECNDVNAGSFHLFLTNMIGLNGQGFIFDITRDVQVWNQPAFRYISNYDLKGKKNEVEVRTKLYYVQEIHPKMERYTIEQIKEAQKFKDYHYILELDDKGNITGGKWLGYERPDYLFIRKSKQFFGLWKELEDIYLKSTTVTENE